MRIFHVPRDYNKKLEEQKKELKAQYADFQYLDCDGAFGKEPKIHFMSSGKKEGKVDEVD